MTQIATLFLCAQRVHPHMFYKKYSSNLFYFTLADYIFPKTLFNNIAEMFNLFLQFLYFSITLLNFSICFYSFNINKYILIFIS